MVQNQAFSTIWRAWVEGMTSEGMGSAMTNSSADSKKTSDGGQPPEQLMQSTGDKCEQRDVGYDGSGTPTLPSSKVSGLASLPDSEASVAPDPTVQPVTQNSQPKLLKTILDRDAVRNVAARLAAATGCAGSAPPLEPVKLLEKYRKASPCKALWNEMDGTARARFCKRCQRHVYDFDQMELSEAESLVFQREGKSKVVLYKREDGKFLTNDCPVGMRRKLFKVVATVCGLLLLIGLMVVLALAPPPAKKRAPLEVAAPICRGKLAKPSQSPDAIKVTVTVIMPKESHVVLHSMGQAALQNQTLSQGNQNLSSGNSTAQAPGLASQNFPSGNSATQPAQGTVAASQNLPSGNPATQLSGAVGQNLPSGNPANQPAQAPGAVGQKKMDPEFQPGD